MNSLACLSGWHRCRLAGLASVLRPALQGAQWQGEVALQRSDQPAAAATLCVSMESRWTGVLVPLCPADIAPEHPPWDSVVASKGERKPSGRDCGLKPDQLLEANDWPVLLASYPTVSRTHVMQGLGMDSWDRSFGRRLGPGGGGRGDPSVGTSWSREDLELLWHGVGLRSTRPSH